MPAAQETKEKEVTEEQSPDPQEVIREMREIQSDAAQLSEIEELEYTQTMKLVESMKAIQAGVGTAISIRPVSLGEPLNHVKQAIIGADAVIIGLDADGKPFSKPLSDLKPADILNVVQEWAPKLRVKISERKKGAEARLYLVEKILREFKEGNSAIKDSRKQFYDSVESDLVKDTLEKE
ncbi:MAG: hypothetical protein JRN59_00125 [Nitrososphaerota archaeon]|jgi:hypothetical protein|nr:hypothetical protein [Nitrososphaerota archaeon]